MLNTKKLSSKLLSQFATPFDKLKVSSRWSCSAQGELFEPHFEIVNKQELSQCR